MLDSLTQLFPILLAMSLSGIVAGLLAGIMGIGGGIVSVPILYTAFSYLGISPEVHMQVTVATSLAIIVPTALFASISHARKDAVLFDVLKQWGLGVFLGAILGSFLASHMRNDALVFFFAIMAGLMGVKMVLPFQNVTISKTFPEARKNFSISLFIGSAASMMGIGGATFSVPAMTLFGIPIHKAVGTGSALGLIVAIPSVISYMYFGAGIDGRPDFSIGFVNMIGLAVIAPVSAAFAPVGVLISHRISSRLLSIIFGIFLLLTAVRMGLPDVWNEMGLF